jgi:glycosyltransferase involved in cell wall biosynthesis
MPSMLGGGAERQMVILLQHLDRSRFEPSLCLLSAEGALLEQIPTDVPIVDLGKRSRNDYARLVVRLARQFREQRPDLIFSKMDYSNTLVALASRLGSASVPLVLGEVAVQSKALQDMTLPRIRRALLGWSYRRAAKVVVASPGVATDLDGVVDVPKSSYELIPNLVDLTAVRRAAEKPASHPFFDRADPVAVTVGLLKPPKGQADAVAAIAALNRVRACNLLVVGNGPERHRLESLARDLGVADRVAFSGFLANPYPVMARADVLVSPSHHESFGNVIVEGMALGVPVVSTRVPAGPEWIIDDGRTGIFAEPHNPNDLAKKIDLVLSDRQLAARLVQAASREVARYDVAAIVSRYERLFEDVASR